MTSPPLDNTQGRQRQAWQAITALGWHIQSDDVGRGMKSAALGQHTLSNDVGCGMLSSPLGITHDRTTSGMTCHHRLWTAHTVRLCGACHDINAFGQHTGDRRRAWHAIIALRQHTQSNDVGRGMKSPPLDSTHGRQCRAWHEITAFG